MNYVFYSSAMCCCCWVVAIIICILSAMNFSLLSGFPLEDAMMTWGCISPAAHTLLFGTERSNSHTHSTSTTHNKRIQEPLWILLFLIFWCHGLVSWLHAIQIHRFPCVVWGWNGTGEVTGRWNTKDELTVRFPTRIVWDIIISQRPLREVLARIDGN